MNNSNKILRSQISFDFLPSSTPITTGAFLALPLLLLIAGCTTPQKPFPKLTPPPAVSGPGNLYDEIANAVDNGSADAIISLQSGQVVLDQAILLVGPETRAHFEAEIRNGRIQRASLEFSERLQMQNARPQLTLSFGKIEFDRYGRATIEDLKVEDPPLYQLLAGVVIPKAKSAIERALALNIYCAAALRGDLFLSQESAGNGVQLGTTREAKERGPAARFSSESKVKSEVLLASLDAIPGLQAGGVARTDGFRPRSTHAAGSLPQVQSIQHLISSITIRVDEATLAAGSKFQFANYEKDPDFGDQSRVFVGRESRITLPYVKLGFNPDTHSLSAVSIDGGDLYLNTIESTLVSSSQTFKLGRESTLLLRDLQLNATRGPLAREWNWSLQTRGGIADIAFAHSVLSLKGMWLKIAQGSSMTLREVNFSGRDKELLQINGQGTLQLTAESGFVSLGPVVLSIGAGSILDIEGVVKSEKSSSGNLDELNVDGQIALMDVKISDLTLDQSAADYLQRIGSSRDGLNVFPLQDLLQPKLAYAKAGAGSRILARNIQFSNSGRWNVNGTVELVDMRALEGRLALGAESSVDFGNESRVTLTELVFDRCRQQIAGKLGGTVNVTGGVLRFRHGEFATRFPLAAPSRLSVDSGAVSFTTQNNAGLRGTISRITIATPPAHNGTSALLLLGPATAVRAVGGLSAPEPSTLVLAAGAAVNVSDLRIDHSGPLSALIDIDATVSEAKLRINELNGFMVARPFAARSASPLRYTRGADVPVSGNIEAEGVEVSAGVLAPGGSTRMSEISGHFEHMALGFAEAGSVTGTVQGGILSFSGGEWQLGPTSLALRQGSAQGVRVNWSAPNNARVTFTASVIDAALELAGVDRRSVADGIVITMEPLISRLRLRDVQASFANTRDLRSLSVGDFALLPTPDSSVLVQVDTQESRVFYETADDKGKPLAQPKSMFGYNQHGIMGVRAWLLDTAPLSGPLVWSDGSFQRLPSIPQRTLRVAFDSKNEHYDTGNKNAERVTLSGNTVKVDGNTKDKVYGQKKRAIRRVIVTSDSTDCADFRVFIWNTAGARNGFDPPDSRPADRPNPPADLSIRFKASLRVRDNGIFLDINDFEWPRLVERVHYDVWIDADDWCEFWGGLINIVTTTFTLGQAGWDPVGEGIRDGRRDADSKLNAGIGLMHDRIVKYFKENPILRGR